MVARVTARERTVLAFALGSLGISWFFKYFRKTRLLNSIQGYVPVPFIRIYKHAMKLTKKNEIQ